MRPSPTLLLMLALLGAACAREDAAREEIIIAPFVTIRGLADSIDVSGHPSPAVSGDARFVAVGRSATPSLVIALFDSSGRYLCTIGRPGRGPGEFAGMMSFGFGPGDSLWVTDNLFSAHVFTPPPAVRYVRTVRFEGLVTAMVTREGFLATPVYSRLHGRARLDGARLFGFDGKLRATYGPPVEGETEPRSSAMALLDSTQAWGARRGEYAIDLLGSDGTVRRALRRDVAWFQPDTTRRTPSDRPRPGVHHIAHGDDGHLWVLVRRAHRDWEPRKSARPAITGPIPIDQLAAGPPVDKLFEGVIEVLDATTGALIATHEVGGGVLGFVRPGIIYEQIEDDAGLMTIVLSRVSLASARRP
jgi:hypothetical protein